MTVIGSPGPRGWLGSGGGGSKAPFSLCRCNDLTSWGCRGRKLLATTAFGMTDTLNGLRLARSVVFSLLCSSQSTDTDAPCNQYASPGMGNANNMIHITKRELQKLVRHYTRGIAEAEKRMIGEDGSQTHRSCMQNALMAQVAERRMPMNDLRLLTDEDLPEDGEGAKDGGECGAPIDDPVRQMIDLDSVCEVSNSCP